MSDFNKTRPVGYWYDHPDFRITKRDVALWWVSKTASDAFDVVNGAIRTLTFKRWCPLYGPMEGRAWRLYLWFACGAWPYDEWRAGRIP